MNSEIIFKTGDIGLLDDIKELWEALNQVHLEKSLNFKQYYRAFTFQARKNSLMANTENKELFIVIAYHKDVKIGYCVSSIADNIGEIDSIYVKPDYQNKHIGNILLETSFNWIKSNNPQKISVKVSVGNEEVFGFYSKYGFKPRLTELQLITE